MRQATAPAGSLWAATMPAGEMVRGTPLDRATSTSTWPSSAPATPACGRRYYLAAADPHLRIAVLEREHVGFGASGRNGGWCSALLATSWSALADRHGARRGDRDEAGDARHRRRGRSRSPPRRARTSSRAGTISLARTAAQHARLAADVDEARTLRLRRGRPPLADARRRSMPRVGPVARAPPCSRRTARARAPAAPGQRHRPGVHRSRGAAARPHRRRRPRAAPVDHAGRSRARRRRRARHRGLHRRPPRTPPRPAADLLADGGVRAARCGRSGTRSGSPAGPRSTTPATRSSTASAPPTVASPSVDAARRTTSVRASSRRSTPTSGCGRCSSTRCATCSPCSPTSTFPFHWGGPLGVPRDWRCTVRFDPASGDRRRRRLRRRRRVDDQPGRPDARRPDHRPRHRSRAPAVGRSPLAALGTRAAALARRQRRPAGGGRRRRRRGRHRPRPHGGGPRRGRGCSTLFTGD